MTRLRQYSAPAPSAARSPSASRTRACPTICVAHPETAGLIALAGLVLESPEGTLTARSEVVERLAKPVDLLLVTVKAPALEDALERVDPEAVADGVVLPLLNGLEHMELLRAALRRPRRRGKHLALPGVPRRARADHRGDAAPVVTIASESSRAASSSGGRLLRRRASTCGSGRARSASSGTSSRASRRSPRRRAAPADGRRAANDPEWRPRLEAAVAEACAVAEADGVGLRRRRSGRSSTRWPTRRRLPRRATSWPAAARSSTRSWAPSLRAGRAARRAVPGADRARRAAGLQVSAPRAVAFVPARSGSERVPHKNIRPLAGHPLLAYAIETALQSGVFERVVVSTDSEEIADVARWYGADVPFLRPAEYATSTSPDIEWLAYTLEQLDERYDLFALVRATNPFRGPGRVRRGLEQLLATPEADSLRAVELVKQHPGRCGCSPRTAGR